MKRKCCTALCIFLAMSSLSASAEAASFSGSLSSMSSALPSSGRKAAGSSEKLQPSSAFQTESELTLSQTESENLRLLNESPETETELFPAGNDSGNSSSLNSGSLNPATITPDEILHLLDPFADDSGISSGPEAGTGNKADEEPDTETEMSPEYKAETEATAQSESLPDSSAKDNPVIGASDHAEQTGASVSNQADLSFSPLRNPHIRNQNTARVSLYDYRMLRSFPLPSLPTDLHSLYYTLSDMVAGYSGTWSVYVEDLSTKQALIIGDRPMKSASVMKLFIMAAVYDRIAAGRLERTDEIVSLLRDMISNSSNEAANRLLLHLGSGDYARGIRIVNRYIRTHGYSSDTREYNGFEDSAAIVDGSHFNQISASDIGLLLERVYSRHFISRSVCNEIENMMLNQATRYKIPRGLPDGIEVANKTGEMDTVENDAAVVYGKDTDFILVVLSEDWDSKNTAQEEIQDIASAVYAYLNEEEE